MMPNLLDDLKQHALEVTLEGHRLKVQGKLTDELRQTIQQNKGLIRATLTLEQLLTVHPWVRIEYPRPGEFIGPYPYEVSKIITPKNLPRIAQDLADLPEWRAYHPCSTEVFSFTERTLN